MSTSPLPAEMLVRQFALYADLSLPTHREAPVASILFAWLSDANELSGKMSAPEYQSLVPATVFTHAPRGDEEV